jgi:hypothetical protein
MNLAPYIVGGVLAAGLGLGYLTAQVAPTSGATRPPGIALDNVRHGGAVAGNAVNRLLALDLAPPRISDTPPDARPPPPPDIAVLFRRDLTAIESGANGRTVMVVDVMEPLLRRRIRPGEPYRDGWVVNTITDQSVELRRRRERRQIEVFGPLPPDPANMVSEP